jgi:hypothetical protein
MLNSRGVSIVITSPSTMVLTGNFFESIFTELAFSISMALSLSRRPTIISTAIQRTVREVTRFGFARRSQKGRGCCRRSMMSASNM